VKGHKGYKRAVPGKVLLVLAALALSASVVTGIALAAGGWSTEVVDINGGGAHDGLGYDNSLDFDSGDLAHISYFDKLHDDLKYATWEEYGGGGGHWVIEFVDAVGKVGKDTSVDAGGNVAISYYDDTNKDLKFAQKIAGSWNITVVDAGGGSSHDHDDAANMGKYTSLEINASGDAMISYYNDSQDDLRFAEQVGSGGNCGGGAWQCVTVDSGGKVGKYTSLAIDFSGRPHISYYDDTNKDLKHAVRVGSGGNCGGGAWQCETVDSAGDVGEHASLAIGQDGRPRIAYHDETNENLNFAMRLSACGEPAGTWVTMAVDEVGDVGEDNSIALKSDDTPCISYNDEHSGALKYACWGSAPPELSLLCPTGAGIRWETYADFQDSNLSVDYTITNDAGAYAYDVEITSAPASNGVTVATPMPYQVSPGLDIGQSAPYTLKFHIPPGVMSFSTSTHGTARDEAGTLFYYPCKSP